MATKKVILPRIGTLRVRRILIDLNAQLRVAKTPEERAALRTARALVRSTVLSTRA